ETFISLSVTLFAKPGESIKLSCKISGFVIQDWYKAWIRQPTGKGLEWLASYDEESNTKYYSSTIEGRFIASIDISSSTFYLQMNNLQTEDSAMYYCARHSHGYCYLHFVIYYYFSLFFMY
uniref:Ig-like domain-containing protein n=1 Tax=Erpetoichthys calabaricus TaxID=27687 RepID=A0A8C4SZ09_ERPCA